MNKLLLFIILLGIWFLISGFFNPLFIFYGVVSSIISILFFSKMLYLSGSEETLIKLKYLSPKFVLYIFWLLKEIVSSSFKVAIEMWKNEPNTKPELKWIKHDLKSDSALTIYANSITLTPGTISMFATKKEVLVHALHSDGIKELEQGKMCNKIKSSIEGD